MACIIFFVLFCCIPIVAVAYAMATRQGASEDEIRSLSKFRYRESNPLNVPNNHKNQEGFGTSAELEKNDPNELLLHPDDSVSIFSQFELVVLSIFQLKPSYE